MQSLIKFISGSVVAAIIIKKLKKARVADVPKLLMPQLMGCGIIITREISIFQWRNIRVTQEA